MDTLGAGILSFIESFSFLIGLGHKVYLIVSFTGSVHFLRFYCTHAIPTGK